MALTSDERRELVALRHVVADLQRALRAVDPSSGDLIAGYQSGIAQAQARIDQLQGQE